MVAPRHDGTTNQFEPKDLRVDTRDIFQKMHQALLKSDGSQLFAIVISSLAVLTIFFPFFLILLTPIALLMIRLYLVPKKRFHNMPYRVPKHAKIPDGSFDALARKVSLWKNPEKAWGDGTYYYGVDRITGQQVWKTDSDERTHDLLIGTTGAGKTETIKMILTNPLLQNSGFIISDAKGTTDLVAELMYLTARFMRQDDMLVTNFITAGRDLLEKQEDKLSNTFNLMSYTSAAMLSEQLVYLLDDSGGSGGDMWKGRTIMYLTALTNILTFLRDRGLLLLQPKTYVEYQELNLIIRVAYGEDFEKYYKIFGEKYITAVSPLRAYLGSLAGFDESRMYKQDAKTNEQHGYVIMSFTRAISDLSFNFGHIYGDKASEIDMFDVVLNRRCLLIVLPALQNAPDTIKMLGKLCVGSLKQMMAGALGNKIDGVVRNVIESKVTASKTCYKVVLDEVGYQIVAGLSVIPAQARGLSFSMTFSAQDVSDILRADEKEGEAIIANTNTKTIGRINSGEQGQTYTRVKGIVSDTNQATIQGYNVETSELFGTNYRQSTNVGIEKRPTVSYKSLATQQEGQFTMIIAKKIDGGKSGVLSAIQMQTMYVTPPKLNKIRLNDFVSIEKELSYFDHIEYEDQIAKLASFIETGTLAQSCPNYGKIEAIGAENRGIQSDLENIGAMFNQNQSNVGSSFYAALRTIQLMLEASSVNDFASPFYEVDVADSSFNDELDNEIDNLFAEVKVENEQLAFVLDETNKIQTQQQADLRPEEILKNIDHYLKLNQNEVQTVTEVQEFVKGNNFIDADQLYSNEFAQRVQAHLKSSDIFISHFSIPSIEDLQQLDQAALDTQKSLTRYVDESMLELCEEDAIQRYQYVEDFINCRDVSVQQMQKEIKDQDVEILQSLEKYYEIIFSQISKNLKDE